MPTPMIHMNRVSGRTTTPNSRPADENAAQPEVSEGSMSTSLTNDGRPMMEGTSGMGMSKATIDNEGV